MSGAWATSWSRPLGLCDQVFADSGMTLALLLHTHGHVDSLGPPDAELSSALRSSHGDSSCGDGQSGLLPGTTSH